jgi:probable F420-dependent oxidoreductase
MEGQGLTARRIGIDVMHALWAFGPGFDHYLEAARAADEAGIGELHISDHLVISEAAIAARPTYPWPLDLPYYESLTALAALAPVTRRIRLATSVLIAPLRSAIFLARQAATVDSISGGRLELGIGAGWQREEFDASNIDFTVRRAVLIEQIGVCRALWGGAAASFSGPTVSFEGLHSPPPPPQGADLPIALGLPGTPGNLRLIAAEANGWTMQPRTPEELRGDIADLRAALATAGREREEIRVTVKLPAFARMTPAESVAAAAELFEGGADTVVARLEPIITRREEMSDYFARLAELAPA